MFGRFRQQHFVDFVVFFGKNKQIVYKMLAKKPINWPKFAVN
jgi:hypothetical protein